MKTLVRGGFFLLILVAPLLQAAPWQPLVSLTISSDGRRLATGGMAGEVLVWESLTGEVLRRVTIGSTPVAGLDFSKDGKQLGIALLDGSFVLDLAHDAPLSALSPSWGRLANAAKDWLKQSPLTGSTASRGDQTARGLPDGHIEIGPTGGAVALAWKAHEAAVTGLVWSPDGRVLYSISVDGSLARWDPQTGKELGRL